MVKIPKATTYAPIYNWPKPINMSSATCSSIRHLASFVHLGLKFSISKDYYRINLYFKGLAVLMRVGIIAADCMLRRHVRLRKSRPSRLLSWAFKTSVILLN